MANQPLITSRRRAAVFLDRDDTILDTRGATADTPWPGDLVEPARVRLLPGAAPAIRRLNDADLVVVVVSNQGAVARGTPVTMADRGRGPGGETCPQSSSSGSGWRPCTLRDVESVNDRMRELLRREAGARLDAVYVCPYHPKGTVAPYNVEHPWRKPAPGMLLAAADYLGLDLGRSWMIGDAERDVEAALRAGIARERAMLVGPGFGHGRTIEEAVAIILRAIAADGNARRE
jgi:D-glycero-D-manno-heptose 1,7-bisphosphate phosphatase